MLLLAMLRRRGRAQKTYEGLVWDRKTLNGEIGSDA